MDPVLLTNLKNILVTYLIDKFFSKIVPKDDPIERDDGKRETNQQAKINAIETDLYKLTLSDIIERYGGVIFYIFKENILSLNLPIVFKNALYNSIELKSICRSMHNY